MVRVPPEYSSNLVSDTMNLWIIHGTSLVIRPVYIFLQSIDRIETVVTQLEAYHTSIYKKLSCEIFKVISLNLNITTSGNPLPF